VTQFIHLADAKQIASIRRNGIKEIRIRGKDFRGFYCTPVSRSGFRTHQWLRELKRRGVKSYEAVQFYLPAKTELYIGRYGQDHLQVTASQALRIFEEHQDGLGLEVIVPRPLHADEIRRVYEPHPVSGWRFYPEAKGRKPCSCEYCNKGEIKARRRINAENESQ
jgi:hypothetical protein